MRSKQFNSAFGPELVSSAFGHAPIWIVGIPCWNMFFMPLKKKKNKLKNLNTFTSTTK